MQRPCVLQGVGVWHPLRSCSRPLPLPRCPRSAHRSPLAPPSSRPPPAQALSHALRVGSPDRLRVYRLYCSGTCEERLLQLSDRMRGLDTLCQQSHGR